MIKPTFVFVPGAWNSPDTYDPVISLLSKDGYPFVKVPLPSVGCDPVTYDFTEDVSAISSAVTTLADEGKDIVLVMHSYSGLPGSEAVRNLGKKEREEKGKSGGVIRLVFVMAFMVPEGFQATERGSTVGFRDFMNKDQVEQGIITLNLPLALSAWFHDLPPPTATHYIRQTAPQSAGVFWSKSTYAGWRYIPSTYVICEDDRSFGVETAEGMIKGAREMGVCEGLRVERVGGGHFAMLSCVEWVGGVLRRAAGEGE